MDINVKIVSGTAGVFPNETGLVRFVDGLLKVRGFLEEFTTDIDVGSTRIHGASGDEATLYQLVGVAAEDFTVLAGARFSLIGIHNQIAGSVGLFSQLIVVILVMRTHRGSFSQPGLFMKLHLRPEGKPAPPRPRRPESLTVWMIQESPLRRMSFVRCQSPRD